MYAAISAESSGDSAPPSATTVPTHSTRRRSQARAKLIIHLSAPPMSRQGVRKAARTLCAGWKGRPREGGGVSSRGLLASASKARAMSELRSPWGGANRGRTQRSLGFILPRRARESQQPDVAARKAFAHVGLV